MNLAYHYPLIYWDCACLISDSGGFESEEIEDEIFVENVSYTTVETFIEETDEDEDEEEGGVKTAIKKKKTISTDYGKIATAVGKIIKEGVRVNPPNINTSSFTFSPNAGDNSISFGLKGIVKVGEEFIKKIIDNRPYTSVEDFMLKVKPNKTQMVSLIKCGSFDSLGSREKIMYEYIELISDIKKTLNLRNMQMLIRENLLPEELDSAKESFIFNKKIKKQKNGNYYLLDNEDFSYLDRVYDIEKLVSSELSESGFAILVLDWDKQYKKDMLLPKEYIKENLDELLEEVNNRATEEMWNKYALGSTAEWEMASICFYSQDHELGSIEVESQSLTEFYSLPEETPIDRFVPIKGRQVPIYKLSRIYGTVIDKDKSKKTVTLLTPNGVVTVKIFGDAFGHYDKQISIKGPDGKKKVIEKSWFSRGNKIIVTGIKKGKNEFLAKKYNRTEWHLVERITQINEDGTFKIQPERKEVVWEQ